MVTQPAVSLAQDRESSPARTSGLTTTLCHQLLLDNVDGFAVPILNVNKQDLHIMYSSVRLSVLLL